MTNRQKFIGLYGSILLRMVRENPGRYRYTLDRVPEVVEQFNTRYLDSGSFNTGDGNLAMAETCRRLGIACTVASIQQFVKD